MVRLQVTQCPSDMDTKARVLKLLLLQVMYLLWKMAMQCLQYTGAKLQLVRSKNGQATDHGYGHEGKGDDASTEQWPENTETTPNTQFEAPLKRKASGNLSSGSSSLRKRAHNHRKLDLSQPEQQYEANLMEEQARKVFRDSAKT